MAEDQPELKTIVVKRSDVDVEHTIETAEGQPNIIIQPVSALYMVLTRTARVYVQSLIGALPIAITGAGLPDDIKALMPTDFVHQLELAAALAFAPAVVTFLQNVLEILVRLDERFPKLRG